MRGQPVLTALGAGHLGVGVIAGPERGDEHLTGVHHPGLWVGDGQGEAGIVNEERFPRPVDLPHRQTDGALPDSVIAGERRVLHAFRVLTVMFFPEELPGHPFSVQFPVDVCPVRLGTSPTGYLIGFLEEENFELEISQFGRQRPGQAGLPSAPDIFLHGTAGHLDAATGVPVAEMEIELEPQDFPYFSHRHTLLGHPSG